MIAVIEEITKLAAVNSIRERKESDAPLNIVRCKVSTINASALLLLTAKRQQKNCHILVRPGDKKPELGTRLASMLPPVGNL